jgi:hypothetical protein
VAGMVDGKDSQFDLDLFKIGRFDH